MTESEKLEKKELMAKLRELGIKFSPNSGIDTLRAKYEAAFTSSDTSSVEKAESTPMKPEQQTKATAFQKAWRDNMKLIRCSIRNNNPLKNGLHGEIITFANPVIGKVSKYVPWDAAGNSYHIPVCIYKILKRRKYLSITSHVDKNTGQMTVERVFKPEFSIEVLPPLTQEELNKLKETQRARAQAPESPALI